jgi:LPS-assembly protein
MLARQIGFDLDAGVATARGVKLRFMGVPILYTPYLSFPLNDGRKSGFLTPSFADRDRTGLDISVPYYLNLAPNYDLTLEPRYMSKRGTQLISDFRYLLPQSGGQLRYEVLPDDTELNRARGYLNLQHHTEIRNTWQILSGIENVSDDFYFEDLSGGIGVTSQTHLNRYVDIGYYARSWSVLSRLQDYQTIDPLIEDIDQPYRRVPQFLFRGRWLGSTLGFNSTNELVNYDRDVGVTGWRFDANEEVSLRFMRPGFFVTPAVALRQTNYWLDQEGATETNFSRTLPVASVDTGLVFEREFKSATRIQTLEPRLLYVYVPFEEQDMLPVFDTVEPDFNIVQLFRKYQFVGPDRLADTNQISFGLTTRIIDGVSGQERLSATFGQTRYLTAQQVSLPGQVPNDANESDYVAELTVNLRDAWNLNVGYQWNSATAQTSRAETRLEYRPQDDRIFGLSYRFREELLEQGDLSLVWPALQRWRVIGRFSYSFLDKTSLEQFLGLEFDACCWRLRLIGRNYISRRTGESDSSLLLQLELKGLSQRSASPEELLGRGILGYQPFGNTEALP